MCLLFRFIEQDFIEALKDSFHPKVLEFGQAMTNRFQFQPQERAD